MPLYGSVTIKNVLNHCVVKPGNMVNTIKYVSNMKWNHIYVMPEGFFVKMFVAMVMNKFVSCLGMCSLVLRAIK